MKNVFLALQCVVLSAFSVNAQLNFEFVDSEILPYEELVDFEELELKDYAQYVPLGFELESFGSTSNQLAIWSNYVGFQFENSKMEAKLYPFALKGTPFIGRGRIRYSREISRDSVVTLIVEYNDLEYEGMNDQYVNFQIHVSSNGLIKMHSGDFVLENNGIDEETEALVLLYDTDFPEEQKINFEEDIFSSVIMLFGNANDPMVFSDVESVNDSGAMYLEGFPPNGTLFTFSFNGLNSSVRGVDRLIQSIEIVPNPVDEVCYVISKEGVLSKLVLFDLQGRVVLDYKNDENQKMIELNLSKLDKGKYILLGYESDELVVRSQVFVK